MSWNQMLLAHAISFFQVPVDIAPIFSVADKFLEKIHWHGDKFAKREALLDKPAPTDLKTHKQVWR